MIDSYSAETDQPILPLGLGARGIGVQRVQEWLGLHGHGVAIDGDFGPATERAVSLFQAERAASPRRDGNVDATTWSALIAPLASAAGGPARYDSLGQAVVAIATAHLAAQAREIGGDNRGPWVRHYCRGQSVAWCQGFASTIWADAARSLDREPPLDLVLDGLWCLFVPRMVQEAKGKDLFMPGGIYDPTLIKPGSMFFLKGGAYGYAHVGLVEAAHDDQTMTTIEGNTNDDGSANGYEVARRVRRVSSSDFAVLP